jgi:hypothetical protein
MFQVTASFKDVVVHAVNPNPVALFFGAATERKTVKPGTVQFTAATIPEAIQKLGYLISDVETVQDLSIKRV